MPRAERWLVALVAVVAGAGCKDKPTPAEQAPPAPPAAVDPDARGAAVTAPVATRRGPVTLPAAPPLPALPLGLPPLPADQVATAEQIWLGRMLFFEARLAADGTTTCAGCHVPANGLSGDEPHSQTAAGKPNLRRAPALINLAWQRELGWDGRGASVGEFLESHTTGQLGQTLERGLTRVLGSPTYVAHFGRADAGGDAVHTATSALWAFVATRYSGDASWDRYEAGDRAAVPAVVVDGYKLFNGKAQCATCHAPPLYTDLGFHRLGLITSPDDGRGRVDPTQMGAFKTPSLRGAFARTPLFHDGSGANLEDAIAWHLGGGRGQRADPSVIDPALVAVTLTAPERAALIAFVRALTPPAAALDAARPPLPDDVPGARP